MESVSDIDVPQPDQEAQRYTRESILRSERMYGYGFQGPGRSELMDAFCARLPDLTGKRILDVGSGLGGPAFYLNQRFGARVDGLDSAPAMTEISSERARGNKDVNFICGDIRTVALEAQSYDLVWSRDCILYIPEKDKVWEAIARILRPGGRLFVTDFCRRPEPLSAEFALYLQQCRYYLRDIAGYAADIQRHGLEVTAQEDITPTFVEYLIREKSELEKDRAGFLSDFSEDDYNYLTQRWDKKRGFCESGDFRWGLFIAHKPA